MADPVAIITEYGHQEIANTGSGPYSITLHGDTSTPSTGGSIITWTWAIISSTLGGATAASITGQGTDTITINDIAEGEAIRVFLYVIDDLGAYSPALPYPVRLEDAPYPVADITDPDAFVAPPNTAFVDVAVELASSELVKSPMGARSWFPVSYWPLIDKVEEHDIAIAALEGGVTDPATASALGLVKLYTGGLVGVPGTAAAPKVPAYLSAHFSASYQGTLAVIADGTTRDDLSSAIIVVRPTFTVRITQVYAALRKRGNGTSDNLDVSLYVLTEAQYETDDYASGTYRGKLTWAKGAGTSRVATLGSAPDANWDEDVSNTYFTISAGSVLLFKVTDEFDVETAEDLFVQLYGYRLI